MHQLVLLKRRIFSLLETVIAIGIKLRIRNALIILNYHQISEKFDPKIHIRGTWTSAELFQRHINYLKKKYKIVQLYNGIQELRNGSLKGINIAITFDDGDKSIENVIPFLEKKKIPATFFINTAYISNILQSPQIMRYFVMEDEDLPPIVLEAYSQQRSIMNSQKYNSNKNIIDDYINNKKHSKEVIVNTEFLDELNKDLFHIGLHGHEHERHSMMKNEWQKANIDRNIEQLGTYKNYRPVFAIPFGKPHDWNEFTIQYCLEKNLEIVTHDGGINFKKNVFYNRIPADGRENVENLISSGFIKQC